MRGCHHCGALSGVDPRGICNACGNPAESEPELNQFGTPVLDQLRADLGQEKELRAHEHATALRIIREQKARIVDLERELGNVLRAMLQAERAIDAAVDLLTDTSMQSVGQRNDRALSALRAGYSDVNARTAQQPKGLQQPDAQGDDDHHVDELHDHRVDGELLDTPEQDADDHQHDQD